MQFDLNEKMLDILHYQHQHAPEGRRLLVSGHFAHEQSGDVAEHIRLHRPPGVPVVGTTEDGLLIEQLHEVTLIDGGFATGVIEDYVAVEIYPVDGFAQTYAYEQKDWVLSR